MYLFMYVYMYVLCHGDNVLCDTGSFGLLFSGLWHGKLKKYVLHVPEKKICI